MSYQGTVKAFREDKGFGFIVAEDGTEVFVHVAACVDGGQPQQGDTVAYDVEPSQVKPGQMQACNVSGGTGQLGGGKGKGKVATGAKGFQQPPFMGGGNSWKGGSGKAFGGDEGKGKDGKSKNKGKGHLLPRTRISEAPFSGTVVEWKGKYGWIQPSESIEHEKAGKHGGRLFFSEDSITAGVALDVGMTVEFHIFEDVSGIGAEEVTDGGAFQAPAKQHAKGAAKGNAVGGKSKGGKDGGFQAPAVQHASGFAKGGVFGGKGKFDTGAKGVQQPMFKGTSSSWKGGFGKAFGADDGKGKDGKSKNKGKGHTLPRTRISEAPFSGEVVEWKGKYGWIQPAEAIEHEKAGKHGGKLFFSQDSIEGGVALDAGATVQFHIFEDASGIGAEEVTVF